MKSFASTHDTSERDAVDVIDELVEEIIEMSVDVDGNCVVVILEVELDGGLSVVVVVVVVAGLEEEVLVVVVD